MDDFKIEGLSVNALKRSLLRTDRLRGYISINDKMPIWDGDIFVYKDKNHNKDNIYGKVPVQVKGKVDNDFSKKEISYLVEISALKTYQRDGGILYFVVYIDEISEKEKIYYEALTPVTIWNYLAGITNDKQKERTIKLKEFPSDNSAKEDIFLNFHINSKKQASFVEKGFLTSEDLLKHATEKSSLSVQVYSFKDDQQPFISDILNNDFHVYNTFDTGVEIPTTIYSNQLEFSEVVNEKVSIKGSVYYSKYKHTQSSKGSVIKIGESLTLMQPQVESDSQVEATIILTSSLRQIVIDLDFIINAIEAKELCVGDYILDLSTPVDNLKGFNIEQQKKRLNDYRKLIELLDILNVKDDLKLDLLTEDARNSLNILIKAFVEKEKVKKLKVDYSPKMIDLIIANLTLRLVINEEDKEKALYSIWDFFKVQNYLSLSLKNQNGDRYIVPPYSLLSKDDYNKFSNIDYDNLLASYQQLVGIDDNIYQSANLNMLNMLLAYDENPNQILFKAIKSVSDWLRSIPNTNLSEELTLLNHLQIIKRERELNEEEEFKLNELIENRHLYSNEMIVAAYLLLGNKSRAEFYFNKLEESTREVFKNYPIYHFF